MLTGLSGAVPERRGTGQRLPLLPGSGESGDEKTRASTMYHWISSLDSLVQTLGIGVVYQYEAIALALAAVAFVLWPDRWWWRFVTWPLFVVGLLYLGFYEMHWHSAIAWPVLIGTIYYWFTRGRWAQLLAQTRWRQWWENLPDLPLDRRGRLKLSGGAVAVALLMYFLPVAWFVILGAALGLYCLVRRYWQAGKVVGLCLAVRLMLHLIPLSSYVLAGLVLGLAVGLLVLLAWARGGQRFLARYLASEPRMGAYFDCVRRLQGQWWGGPRRSWLADHRLTGRRGPLAGSDRRRLTRWGFWRLVFWTCSWRALAWLLCWFAPRRRLARLPSRLVVEGLQHERERIWQEYQRARYAESLDTYLPKLAGRPGVTPDDPVPAEWETSQQPEPGDARRVRGLRLRWLALTEALAECCFFGQPDGTPGVTAPPDQPPLPEQPDLLVAAGLLSGAAELQHEVARDLAVYGDGRPQRELAVAVHFFDAAARCLECYLEPGYRPPRTRAAGERQIPERVERFCRPLLDDATWPTSDRQGSGSAEAPAGQRQQAEPHIRLALLWLYLALAELIACRERPTAATEDGADDEQAEHPLRQWLRAQGPAWFRDLRPALQRPQPRGEPEATLIQYAAYATLRLVESPAIGNLPPFPVLQDADARDDSALLVLAGLLESLQQKERLEARRIWTLRGRLSELEMDRQERGSGFWWRHCRAAAAAYRNAQAARAWRLCASAPGHVRAMAAPVEMQVE